MKRNFFFLLLVLFTAGITGAQVNVIKPVSRKTGIDFSGMRAAPDGVSQQFYQTLEQDLKRSGWFDIARGGSTDFRLIGTVNQDAGNVKAVCQVYRRADNQRIFAKSYSSTPAGVRSLAHAAADEIVLALTGHKGFAAAKIVSVGTRSGAKELYLCDADGGSLQQITRDGRIIVRPRWTPDGSSILFTSYLRGFPDVYRTHLQTGRRELLANYAGLNTGAAIAPDGRDLALILSKDGNPELYLKNLRSGKLTRLTYTSPEVESSPAWSPDGQSLVYVSDQSGGPQLYIISRTGGRPRRISSRGTENVAPEWGANGMIVCSSRSGGRYHIAVIHPVTGQTTYLPNDGADYEDPSWMPDGRHIVCARTAAHQSALYLLDTRGDAPVILLQGGGDWYSPASSPAK
ncbi:MAG: hypothetical protein WC959_11510 [Kiritimatiellales bacterium]